MRNKELKVGDRVWIYAAYMSRLKSGYTVKSVKKSKTLVTIVAEADWSIGNEKPYEVTMYGHCNSSILSGFDRKYGQDYTCYTCDYVLIEEKSRRADEDAKLKHAGRALLNVVEFFKY